MMIHSVYFWLRPDLAPEDVARFEAEVRKLVSIDLVRRGFVGRPAATPDRPVTDKSFSFHLELEFASVEDHDRYQAHPDHDVFVDGCRDLWERVVVYDSAD